MEEKNIQKRKYDTKKKFLEERITKLKMQKKREERRKS